MFEKQQKVVSPYDQDMNEITIEEPSKRQELDLIDISRPTVESERAKKIAALVARRHAIEQKLAANNQEIVKCQQKEVKFQQLEPKPTKIEDLTESEPKPEPEPIEPESIEPEPAESAEPESTESEPTEPEPAEFELETESENPNPLMAVGVDWSRSEKRLARKSAREALNHELSTAGLIKKIWKGNLFRNHFERKYTNQYLNGTRTFDDGKTIADAIDEAKQQLVEETVNEISQVDRENWDKKLIPVEKETSDKIRTTIEDYARFMVEFAEIRPEEAKDPEIVKQIDKKFNNYMDRIIKKATKEGKIKGDIGGNNYLNVAKEAANRYKEAAQNAANAVEQEAAMARVMAGFKVYNAKYSEEFTTRQRTNADKIIDYIGSDEIGNVISADALSEAIDTINRTPEESGIIDSINSNKELLGGDEGIEIMLDKSPLTPQSRQRWSEWWNSLSDEGRDFAINVVKQVNACPDRYKFKWGNGVRAWLTVTNAGEFLTRHTI